MEQTEDKYFNKLRGKVRYSLSIRERDGAIRDLEASALRTRRFEKARGEQSNGPLQGYN
jgi:predicted transcriptional regulator